MTNRPFPLIAAHTGCNDTPYNTVESFMEGLRLGADIVEVDLRIVRDGTVILLHDDSPYIHEYDFGQLNEPDVRTKIHALYGRHEIVRLSDVLELAKKHNTRLNLDIKTVAAIEPVIRLVREHDAVERVYITGCSENITNRHSDIRVVLNTPTKLTPDERDSYRSFAEKVCLEGTRGCYYGLNMHIDTCRPEVVELAHERGLAVWVYTVNEPDAMLRLIRCGVDAITTKDVARLGELRADFVAR